MSFLLYILSLFLLYKSFYYSWTFIPRQHSISETIPLSKKVCFYVNLNIVIFHLAFFLNKCERNNLYYDFYAVSLYIISVFQCISPFFIVIHFCGFVLLVSSTILTMLYYNHYFIVLFYFFILFKLAQRTKYSLIYEYIVLCTGVCMAYNMPECMVN